MVSCTIEVRLKPRAKRESVVVTPEGHVDIAVTSPPVDNAANEHLVKLLSSKLRIPKSSVSIIRGGHSKNKAVAIEGLSLEAVLETLGAP